MELEIKCFATLAEFSPPGGKLTLAEGMTVVQVIDLLGVPLDDVRIIFVNGVHAEVDTVLQSGDRLGLFPPVGGG